MRIGLVLAVFVLACEGAPDPASRPVAPAPFLDPQLIATDGAQRLDLLRGQGRLKAGSDWLTQSRKSRLERWSTVVWTGQTPTVYFTRPFSVRPVRGPLELRIRSAPFEYEGAPVQTLIPRVNGTDLEEINLDKGYQSLRISIPTEPLMDGINTLEFRFAHAKSPLEAGTGAEPRARAAAFESIELVPAGAHEADSEFGFDPENGRIRLAAAPAEDATATIADSTIALPLPGGHAVTLRLGQVRGGDETSRLSVMVRTRESSEQVWHGAPSTVEPSLRFQTPRTPSRLVLSHTAAGPARPIEFDWNERSIGAIDENPKDEPRPPHVFLYLIDTLRADALGLYGSERATSPRIEGFARDSVTFLRAWSTSAWTLPSTMSVLTGVYPSNHGYTLVRTRPSEPRQVMLPERLGAHGYETLAISQSYLVSDVYGFGRGFDTFYVSDALNRGTSESAAVPWFLWQHLYDRPDSGRPLFAYVHTVDPHQPYDPQGDDLRFADEHPGSLRDWQYAPEVFVERDLADDAGEVAHMRARYDGEVRHADRQFGAFLDFLKYLGLYEDSLVVLTADHGEEFAEHGSFGHGQSLFEEQVHVPLLIKFPGSRHAGKRIEARVSLVDLAPTVLEVAGADPDTFDFDGVSLARPTELDATRPLFAETQKKGRKRPEQVDLKALAVGTLKCVYGERAPSPEAPPVPVFQTFDLERDPAEKSALPRDSEEAALCLGKLRELLQADLPLSPTTLDVTLDQDQLDRLRALGYLD